MFEKLRPATLDEIAQHKQLLTDLVGVVQVIDVASRVGLKRALSRSWRDLSKFQEGGNPESFLTDWNRDSALVVACYVPRMQRYANYGSTRGRSEMVGWEERGTTGLENFVVKRTRLHEDSSLSICQGGDALSIDLSATFRKERAEKNAFGGEVFTIKSDDFSIMFNDRGKIIHLRYRRYRQSLNPLDPTGGQELYLSSNHELNLLGLLPPWTT